MRCLIIRNFALSVLVTVVGGWTLFGVQASGFPASLADLGPLKNQSLMFPAVAALSMLFWFCCYRHEEGHVAAVVLGVLMLVPVLGAAVSTAVNDVPFGGVELLFTLYVGLSHVACSLLNWRELAAPIDP